MSESQRTTRPAIDSPTSTTTSATADASDATAPEPLALPLAPARDGDHSRFRSSGTAGRRTQGSLLPGPLRTLGTTTPSPIPTSTPCFAPGFTSAPAFPAFTSCARHPAMFQGCYARTTLSESTSADRNQIMYMLNT